ncbi:MAG TPA: GNAT family N-acetyltransferase [Thermoanaerobaculia bacterium]|jgi:ribosomal protein S18 acetylase RimI-like enzyme|nr:GNAT family N-acetyltransferase [Thermoanaerobaculia bacterium]
MLPAAPVEVRFARPDDAATIADFNVRLALESEGLALEPATAQAGVEALLADRAKGVYLVAESGGRIVGQLMLTVEWSDWRNGPIYWLQSVYVAPESRGSGVFRALWERALLMARDDGARAVRLYVDEHNGHAQEVYRRIGMRDSGYRVFELEPV